MKKLLISIDGPDGSGKSTFSRILLEFLQKRTDNHRDVVLVKPTYFETSPEAILIKQKLEFSENIKVYSREHNNFYLEAMRINYQKIVIPYLEKEKIVILDSSEIRALAFNLAKAEKDAIFDTKEKIKNGFLTDNIFPDVRIILDGSSFSLFKNLKTKNFLDTGDPINLQEVCKRRDAYIEAVKFVNDLNYEKNIRVYNFKIKHSLNPEKYLKNLIISKIENFFI